MPSKTAAPIFVVKRHGGKRCCLSRLTFFYSFYTAAYPDENYWNGEMKLKQNWNSFETVLFQSKQTWNVWAVLANHSWYPLFMQTAVYDAVNKTLVNKHGRY